MKQPDDAKEIDAIPDPEEGQSGIRRKGPLYREVDPDDPTLLVNRSKSDSKVPLPNSIPEPAVRRSSVPPMTPPAQSGVLCKSWTPSPFGTPSPCPYKLHSGGRLGERKLEMTDVFSTPVPPRPEESRTTQAVESELEYFLRECAETSFGEGRSRMYLVGSASKKRRITVPFQDSHHRIAILSTSRTLVGQAEYHGQYIRPVDKLMPIMKFIASLAQSLYSSRLPVSITELESDVEKVARSYRDTMANSAGIPSSNIRFRLALGPKMMHKRPRGWEGKNKAKLIVELEFIEDTDQYLSPEFIEGYNCMVRGRRDNQSRLLFYELHPRMELRRDPTCTDLIIGFYDEVLDDGVPGIEHYLAER